MSIPKYFVGPTLGKAGEPLLYCLDSDESGMICPEDQFTEHAKAADEEYVRNNSAFILAALATTKKDDNFILDGEFKNVPHLLRWQISIYKKLGLQPTQNIHFAPVKTFATLAKTLAQKEKIKTISTIGYSFLMQKFFPIDPILKVSKTVNAKTSLLPLSQKYHFSIPKSVLCKLSELTVAKLKILDFPAKPVYLKIDGLGGGYNVKKITSNDELKHFLGIHKNNSAKVLAQQGVSSDFIETEHIFIIYPTHTKYLYSSTQITKDSAWYGNIFLRNPTLTTTQYTALLNATKALQNEGYAHEKGLLVGFDSLANAKEMYILEINARWLGSLPVERLLRKLGLLNKQTIFSSFDYVTEHDFVKYMEFAENYLYNKLKQTDFSFIPLAFSAYLVDSTRVVYFVVTGDIKAFAKTLRSIFSKDSFTMLNNSLEFIAHVSQLQEM